MFHHLCLAYVPEIKGGIFVGGIKNTPLYILINGDLAVFFFFVLSGFVLSIGFYNNFRWDKLVMSIAKRLPRLWLPAALSILAGLLVIQMGGIGISERVGTIEGSNWLSSFANAKIPEGTSFSLLDALRQSVSVFLVPKDFYYNSNLWTMFFELWGSMAVFLLLPVIVALRSFGVGTPVIILVHLAALAVLILDRHTPMAAFVAGSALCYLYLHGKTDLRLSRRHLFLLVCIAAPGAAVGSGPVSVATLAAAIAFLAILLFYPGFTEILSGPTGKWLGALSFPLYLTHTVMLLGPGNWMHLNSGSPIAAMAFTTVLSVALPLVYVDRGWTRRVNSVFNTKRLKRLRTALDP